MARPRLYTPESVESGLNLHVPGRWHRQAFGYVVTGTALGDLHLRTLKEAHAFVCGCADITRQQREAKAS